MYLRSSHNKKTGRAYLSIVHGYRDKEGNSKQKTVKSIGYVDELEKEYDDPIAHFTAVAEATHPNTSKHTIMGLPDIL